MTGSSHIDGAALLAQADGRAVRVADECHPELVVGVAMHPVRLGQARWPALVERDRRNATTAVLSTLQPR